MVENLNNGAVLGAEVILEFEKSINNIKSFAQVMEELDSRFGRIEQRVDALRSSLNSLAAQTTRGSGNQLRRAIEEEINNIVAANRVVLSSVGNAPFRVKQDTIRHIFRRIDAELNRAIARSIADINIKLDPNFYSGQFALGKSEFEAFNREVARLVNTHVSKLVDNLRQKGLELVNPHEFKGLQLTISRGTVKEIMQSIKRQLMPILLNPEIPKEGISFQLSPKDIRELANKLKKQIIASLEIGVDNLSKEQIDLSEETRKKLLQATQEIDGYLNKYIESIRRGVATIDTSSMVVPLENMSRSLKKYIARDLGVSVQNLEKTFENLRVGEVTGYELRRQFLSLENVINSKLRTGVSSLMTELKRSVREVEIHPQPRLKHYLINEIAKLNNEIVKKIREQIDEQFKAMRAELQTINVAPKQINRSGRIRKMAEGYAQLEGGEVRPYVSHLPPVPSRPRVQLPPGFGNDPYARRDAYFNAFGLQGAVINTVRHILAGGIVGTPIMLVYSALDAFKTSQLEQVKMFQNLILKDEYQDEQGNILYNQVLADIQSELVPAIKELSVLYGLTYDQMSQAAAIGTRSLNTTEEVKQFLDYAGMIQRLDSEADLVDVVAPGLEAIKNQFNMSVWNLDEAVIALAVASNATKATTEELIEALQRSGSSLYMSGLDIKDAAAMESIFLHYTGLSGSDIGNMVKSITARLSMPTHVNKLEEYGIQIYEVDENGLRRMRNFIDILTDIANLSVRTNMDEEELQQILFSQAGGYQINKLKAGIEAFADPELSMSPINYHKIREQMDRMTMEEIDRMLASSLNSTVMATERAWTAVQASLVSILEELSPEIKTLMQNITNFSNNVRESAGLIEDFITIVGNALIGYVAFFSGRKLLNAGGYQEILEGMMTVDRILGRRGWRGEITREGNVNQFLPFLGNIEADITNRKFLETAYKDATLAPLIIELANMNEQRMNEFREYLKHNRPNDLVDFFMGIQESKGYKPPEKLTAEEIQNRSAHNVRMITQNKYLTSVMAEELVDELMNIFSNKENYLAFNSTLENRRFTRQLARMSDVDLRAFEQFVTANYTANGRSLSSINDLVEAFRNFREEQERVIEEARRSSPAFVAISSAIEKTRNQLEKSINTKNTIIEFINELPNKARSGAAALANLTKEVAKFAAQAGIFFVIGDILGNWFSYANMSPTERKQKELEVQVTETAKEYIESFDQGFFENMLSGSLRFVRFFTNLLTPGVHGVDTAMYDTFEVQFKDWLRETYGSGNVRRVSEQEGKSIEELVNEYLGASGLQQQLNEINQQVFEEQARQARLDEELVQNMKEAADKERMERQLLQDLISRGFYFTKAHLIESLEQANEELENAAQLEELRALLRGVKTYSDEYFNIKEKLLKDEIQNYKQMIGGLKDFIEEQKNELKRLEATGKAWTIDPETGQRVETERYKQVKQNIERESNKLEQIQKEYGDKYLAIKENELTELRLTRVLTQAERRLREIEFNKTMTDLSNSLYLDRNTPEYIDAQIESQQRYIESLKELLNELKAKDLVDPNDELKQRIMSLEETIANAEVTVKDLALRRITGYRYDLERFDLEQEIEYLRAQVNLGTTDSDHPVLRQLRMSQGNERRMELERIMADLKAEMKGESDPEILEAYQRELLQIERDSLRTQLSMLEELRGGAGTFNVPEGFKVMTEYEYMRSLGTHTSYSFGLGDMNVNVILPNITNATTPEQMKIIAESVAIGMMNGRLSSLRHMITSGPWGYKAR